MKYKRQQILRGIQQTFHLPLVVNKLEDKKVEKERNNLTIWIALVCCAFAVSIIIGLTVINQGSTIQQFLVNHLNLETHNIGYTAKVSEKIVSCYYNTPDVNSTHQLMPSNINPHLCTHINIAFAQVRDKRIYLDNLQYQTIREVVKLKKINPGLKILLSVGGAGNSDGFSQMVINHAFRKDFIKSIKYTLRNHSLDGIDLDWEFPGIKTLQSNIFKRERQHFSQLLREIRMEYIREKRNYLLTVAIAAQKVIADFAYDVDQINMYVDYVNLMTYDFHFFTKFTPFTGLNSPVYSRASEHLYMATLNINYTIHMYLDKGLDASKIVLGIPTYGHSFTLVNERNTNIGSPAKGFGTTGNLGFVNYIDICLFMSTKENITIEVDQYAKVPYFYKNTEWVSFDDPQSVKEKAEFIKSNNLGGAMIYSLNADDFEGVCKQLSGSEKFPLTLSINTALRGDKPPYSKLP